ncbi:MAG: LytTR family transcriptional regulator [Clostridiales bacterium]|nr:LytTR family transcriptional regulator [Clostridiales bacterium]MBR0468864.1 LytTR family transcriptional regulator DNA-binding domain-containing protein [Mogibacterium sp.]
MQKYDYQKKRRHALPEFISVISSNSCAKIRIDDIEVLEQDGRRIHVITAAKDYTFYGGLNMIAGSLAERAFYRPIKRLIINLDHVSDINSYSINFRSGQSVSLGKNALLSTKRAFKRYLLRYPPYTMWEPIAMGGGAVAEPYAGEDDIVVQDIAEEDDNTPELLN